MRRRQTPFWHALKLCSAYTWSMCCSRMLSSEQLEKPLVGSKTLHKPQTIAAWEFKHEDPDAGDIDAAESNAHSTRT